MTAPGDIKQSETLPIPNNSRVLPSAAVQEYLWVCDERKGKSGKERKFTPTEVITYSDKEMQEFFAVCNAEEELLFKFLLHSMAREMEVAHCEVRDLKFDKNILHTCPKPDRGFHLKGKRSGQVTKGRKVPIPSIFMARMQAFRKGKKPRDLIFPNNKGGVEQHCLRRCEKMARRAGLNWEDSNLHRWRKTGATRHHVKGVSVRKIQAWLGHESLEVTLDCLGVDDAADEISREQVNNGALAACVLSAQRNTTPRLSQARIDQAFQNQPRRSSFAFQLEQQSILVLHGKHTGTPMSQQLNARQQEPCARPRSNGHSSTARYGRRMQVDPGSCRRSARCV